jgi:hypothetical protein
MKLVNLNIKNKVMSIAEMKLAAINEISNLNDEKALKEVLSVLAGLAKPEQIDNMNLSQHYENIKNQYSKVLEKLVQ